MSRTFNKINIRLGRGPPGATPQGGPPGAAPPRGPPGAIPPRGPPGGFLLPPFLFLASFVKAGILFS